MGIRTYNPTTPSRRFMTGSTFEEITRTRPEKSLTRTLKKTAGRNVYGRITVRHHGGGAKQMLRAIDFKRDKFGIPGKVASVEYDPNRTAYIALVHYADGEKRYILAPLGLKVGEAIMSGETAEIKTGNSLPLKLIPTGTMVHNIELERGRGGQMVRSAGGAAQLMAKEEGYALIRLPSNELRRVRGECYATIGQVGNLDRSNIKIGKAGRNRWRGLRPEVRGKAMTPRNHPHGGGEGKSPIGMPGPKTPWGKPTLGYKTRSKKKPSERLIIKHRSK